MFFRYRFTTKSYKDKGFHNKFVALRMPYWISAEYEDKGYAVVTCYFPAALSLKNIFEDAENIEAVQCGSIEYSKRFPKPDWIEG